MPDRLRRPLLASALLLVAACATTMTPVADPPFDRYLLGYDTPVDPGLQAELERLDGELRDRHGMTAEHTAVGLLDLTTLRLALIRPDRGEYAASVPKIGILRMCRPV